VQKRFRGEEKYILTQKKGKVCENFDQKSEPQKEGHFATPRGKTSGKHLLEGKKTSGKGSMRVGGTPSEGSFPDLFRKKRGRDLAEDLFGFQSREK